MASIPTSVTPQPVKLSESIESQNWTKYWFMKSSIPSSPIGLSMGKSDLLHHVLYSNPEPAPAFEHIRLSPPVA